MTKTIVLYDKKDPTYVGVRHVAIQTETQPPYVFQVYMTSFREDLPRSLPSDILLISVDQARKLFNFQKGNIADVVRNPMKEKEEK